MLESNHSTFYVQSFQVSFSYKFLVLNPSFNAKRIENDYFPLPSNFEMVFYITSKHVHALNILKSTPYLSYKSQQSFKPKNRENKLIEYNFFLLLILFAHSIIWLNFDCYLVELSYGFLRQPITTLLLPREFEPSTYNFSNLTRTV